MRRADDANRKVELRMAWPSPRRRSGSERRVRHLRPRPRRRSRERGHARGPRSARPRDEPLPDLARVFEDLASGQTDAELGSRLYTFAARVVESDVGDVERAIELYRKVLSIDPTNWRVESLQTLFQVDRAVRGHVAHLAAQSRDPHRPRRAEGRAHQAATLEEGSSSAGERGSPSTSRCCTSTPKTCGASTRW